jgi:3-deoxy-7-phosphoheptulonate synthase
MFHATDDLRITEIRPLISPAILEEELPISERASTTVAESRRGIEAILKSRDDRLLAVVGPCSIHDPQAALEYGERLREVALRVKDALLVVMRVYFEKPRTTVGWKGLINDPDLDGRFAINRGLRLARKLLLDLAEIGVPAGSELLDTITPQFIASLLSWGSIGARTTESQIHRQLASGLSMPVGFKNGTDGNTEVAVDAVRAAAHSHHFPGVTHQGISAIVGTRGNDCCHVILRGSSHGPNYQAESVAEVAAALSRAGLTARVLIDCSHGNSGKDHTRQPAVARDVALQVRSGSASVMGVMVESHLVAGRQTYQPGAKLQYGQSITDACIGWEDTVPLLEELADAARERRRLLG